MADESKGHEHKLVYVGDYDEGYGKRALRWCHECGILFEDYGERRFAEMVPSWSKSRLEEMDRKKEIYKRVATPAPYSKMQKSEEVSLKKLIAQEQDLKMDKLF